MEDIETLRAILTAYKAVMDASWPSLHPAMKDRARQWGTMSQMDLDAELGDYVRESTRSDHKVRVFWKLGKDFKFGGCNDLFARDGGFTRASELVGLDDFDKRLPWGHQAAKYRIDDEGVVASGEPKLDILERQQSSSGITWVRAGKAPIRKAGGDVVGILGMYELLDSETGRKLYAERNLKRRNQ